MKISATSLIGTNYSNKIKEENKNNVVKTNNNFKISNNTLSEAIGRSQVVSFSGTNKMSGNTFQHDCSEMFGDKEHIVYNKEDGSFTHKILRRDGSLKRQEDFFPMDQTEIITTVDDIGRKTITSKFPTKVITEKFNENGKETLYHEQNSNGNEEKVITDYKRQRKVIQVNRNGKSYIKVIDLKTNKSVTQGDIVVDRRYDKYSDTYYTENIVTGQVLKKEKFMSNGKIAASTEYSEKTGYVTREIIFDKSTGGYFEYNYDDNGIKTSFVKTSKDGRLKEVIEYGRDGKTIIKDMEYQYSRTGDLEYEINYIPGTEIIDEETVYDNEDSYTVYKYNRNPNVPKYAECYNDGELLEQIAYYKDGETIYCSRKYKEDGSYSESYYSDNGYKKESRYYAKDGFLYVSALYNTQTGDLRSKTEYNRQTKQSLETIFNEVSKEIKRTILRNGQGEIEERTDFYEDGRTPKRKITYNYDRSYSETLYDEFGRRTSRIEYNADGSQKVSSSNRTNSTTQQRDKTATIEDFLKNINDILAQDNLQEISRRDWEILAKIFELDNIDSVKNMDHKTYRRLAMKYHPDLNANKDHLEICEQILRIINHLYHKNN